MFLIFPYLNYLCQVSEEGIQKKPGIFISRLLPGGLADSTGLLSVGDEVLEVNNISLEGKFLNLFWGH